jgi:hypothetical protein
MGVKSEWYGDQFEEGFFDAISKELVKSASILRRNLSTVLATTGKSPPPSPDGSSIPFNRTGTLARSWHASPTASRSAGKFTAGVGTNVKYAWYLYDKGKKYNNTKGGRNFMKEDLYWYQKTVSMIKKRLDPQRLIKVATGRFRT